MHVKLTNHQEQMSVIQRLLLMLATIVVTIIINLFMLKVVQAVSCNQSTLIFYPSLEGQCTAALITGFIIGCSSFIWKEEGCYFFFLSNETTKKQIHKFWILSTLFFLVFGIAFLLLALDYYIVFKEDKIVNNRFWGIGAKTYDYSQIVEISYSPTFRSMAGKTINRPEVIVNFNDGKKWISSYNGPFEAGAEMNLLVKILSEKSSVEFQYPDF